MHHIHRQLMCSCNYCDNMVQVPLIAITRGLVLQDTINSKDVKVGILHLLQQRV